MAKAPKPVALISKHLTKEEKEARVESEKKLKGNNNKVYKVPKGTIKPIADIYKCLVKELKAADILNNLDIELLLTTANAIYRMHEARTILNEMGSVVRIYKDKFDKDGNFIEKELVSIYKNPAVQTEKDYHGIYHTGCLQLGLSPSSRAKLSIIQIENEGESKEDKIF